MPKRKKGRKKPEKLKEPESKLRIDLKFGKNLNTVLLIAFALIVITAIMYNFPFEIPYATTTTTIAPTTTIPTTTTTTLPPTPKGTLIIALKDEDHKLPGGAVVKSMNFTVTGVGVYSDGEWMSVLDGQKTLDLLKYTTTFAKAAEKEIDAGGYEKIKVELSDGTVSIVHTAVGIYRPKTYNLIVQEETTVEHEFNIIDGGTLTLVLDFDVENSVRRAGLGYSLTPVITVTEQVGIAENMEEI